MNVRHLAGNFSPISNNTALLSRATQNRYDISGHHLFDCRCYGVQEIKRLGGSLIGWFRVAKKQYYRKF
jgi:hypothetical protein